MFLVHQQLTQGSNTLADAATADNQSTAIVPAGIDPRIADAIRSGKITDLDALVKAFEAPPLPVKRTPPPLPVAISDDQRVALTRLPEVFASVVPTERRAIEPKEVDMLLDERAVLKSIEELVKKRLDAIALTVNIHNTETAEAAIAAAEAEAGDDPEAKAAARERVLADLGAVLDAEGNPFYTDKGHFAAKAYIDGEDEAVQECFEVRVSKGKAAMSRERLKELADDPDVDFIDHKDYLSMTTQVREFDPAKAIIAVRKKPELLRAVGQATTTSAPTVSVYVSKKKNER